MEALKSFGAFRFAFVVGLVVAAACGYILTTHFLAQPSKTLLFSNLDPRDSSDIIQRLDAKKVDYEIIGDGSTIMVPSDQALRLRMEMAGEGLPAGGPVGYEIFDRSESFGQTSFIQNINQLRALEGELSRTIRSIQPVSNARVHLNIPKRELFAERKTAPTASVVIKARGQLQPGQVVAIQNLVASAVEGLTANNITVIDEKGNLLASGVPGAGGPIALQQERQTTSFEDRVRAQVEDIVSGIVGPGRARVQVSAEIDYSRITRETTKFDPEGQVVRSTVTSQTASTSQDGAAAQGVTVANALPDAGDNASGSSTSSDKQTQETINYEISKTSQSEIVEGGNVKRLSVAVAVDGSYSTDAKGTRNYQPRSAEEMQQIEQLVKSAIGFSDQRGDQLKVVNLRFSQPEIEQLAPAEEPFLGLDKSDILYLSQFIGIGIIALLLIFFVMRPMIKALSSPATGGLLVAQAVPIGGTLAAGPDGAQAVAAPAGIAPRLQNMIDISQVEGQVKESSIHKVGEIASKHPEATVGIVRQWLHETK
ncbi:MAG: flagellar basal-body MS-ring/collar protein FliF [Alphaproteobacteria bacterium]|jgi:flagellar M-ring protein FliF